MVTLTRANRELFRRTPDECFDSFEALHRKACYDRENSVDRWIRPQEMLVTQQLGFCCDGQEFSLNDWSFSQVCKMSRVHRDTINRLSSQTASKAFEETLPRKEKPIQLLTRGELIRSVHGVTYTRLWNADLLDVVSEFASENGPACAIIKHANPCGVARGATMAEAYTRAFDCDRTSAFGGIIALNQPLDEPTAEAISSIFTEVVIAPGADAGARAVFAKKKNLRLLTTDGLSNPDLAKLAVRQVSGGYLVQDKDVGRITADDLKVVTKRQPSDQELSDLLFAWTVAKHVKSNAIIYVKDGATVGVGAGQMSRVDSTRIAARKAQDMAEAMGLPAPLTQGSVVASDAFFPFADGLITAAEAGATALIQPGGSMRDDEVIAAADEAGLAMVFTNMRHFRH